MWSRNSCIWSRVDGAISPSCFLTVCSLLLDHSGLRESWILKVVCEDYESVCVPAISMGTSNEWKYRFARSAIVAHLLAVGAQDGAVVSFKSHEDIGFKQYLAKTRPYFAVAHDGADIIDSEHIAAEDKESLRAALLENLKKWIDLGFNVVIINDIVFRDRKVCSQVYTEPTPSTAN